VLEIEVRVRGLNFDADSLEISLFVRLSNYQIRFTYLACSFVSLAPAKNLSLSVEIIDLFALSLYCPFYEVKDQVLFSFLKDV
jgi:hypothetical protein